MKSSTSGLLPNVTVQLMHQHLLRRSKLPRDVCAITSTDGRIPWYACMLSLIRADLSQQNHECRANYFFIDCRGLLSHICRTPRILITTSMDITCQTFQTICLERSSILHVPATSWAQQRVSRHGSTSISSTCRIIQSRPLSKWMHLLLIAHGCTATPAVRTLRQPSDLCSAESNQPTDSVTSVQRKIYAVQQFLSVSADISTNKARNKESLCTIH